MTRACGKCGSLDLGFVDHASGLYLRKECLACGSTGPFVPATDDRPGAYGLPSRREYREQADRLFRQLREGS